MPQAAYLHCQSCGHMIDNARRRAHGRSVNIAAYTRVSSDQQAEHGFGLDVQRDLIAAWAKKHGHRITVWAADEGVSGSNGLDTRVGLLDAFAALQRREVGGIVVARLDRLARDAILQEQLLREAWRSGGRVFSTSPSEDAYLDPDGAEADPARALIRHVLASVAQYERSLVRLRLMAGKQRKRKGGGYIGGQVPLGYRAGEGDLTPDEDEQRTIERMRELRAEGVSLRGICAALTAEGHKTKNGKTWHPYSVTVILRRVESDPVRDASQVAAR